MKNRIYMFDNAENRQMMSFIITTEDRKTIVIDGGYDEDAEKLLTKLKKITQSDRPHVDAWFLTHAHGDHINALATLLENAPADFTCGGYYYCFPSVQYFEKYERESVPRLSRFYANLPKIASVAHTVSTGDCYRIGTASFEILQTYDDTETEDIVNNSTTVIRMALNGKTVLFLGDAGAKAGDRLVARYGKALKSDICQTAHHGQDGAKREVYEMIRAHTCLWCAPYWLWENNQFYSSDPALNGTGPFTTLETRAWVAEFGCTTNYVAKDGDQIIEL
ncbi:MAG: MBL fold metallo-hydrolase [Clostridia bacterium]|nr:MBL fold metallo-hydrolase [Clostridia bacterium]